MSPSTVQLKYTIRRYSNNSKSNQSWYSTTMIDSLKLKNRFCEIIVLGYISDISRQPGISLRPLECTHVATSYLPLFLYLFEPVFGQLRCQLDALKVNGIFQRHNKKLHTITAPTKYTMRCIYAFILKQNSQRNTDVNSVYGIYWHVSSTCALLQRSAISLQYKLTNRKRQRPISIHSHNCNTQHRP